MCIHLIIFIYRFISNYSQKICQWNHNLTFCWKWNSYLILWRQWNHNFTFCWKWNRECNFYLSKSKWPTDQHHPSCDESM